MTTPNYGYVLNPRAGLLEHRLAAHACAHLMQAEPKDTLLFLALFQVYPEWSYGMQGIGDCMSWSKAHNETILDAVAAALGKQRWRAPVATEPGYGFMRVEVFGRPDRGGDGAYGGAAAKAATEWGCLYRMQYSSAEYPGLGSEYDFRKYSGALAKQYGRTGVPDELEPIARNHTCQATALCTSFEQAAAAIQSGYPVSNAHSRNLIYSGRDKEGFGTGGSPAAHAMNYTAVRHGRRPGLWLANTGHGNHVSGPVGADDDGKPFPIPETYAACGCWQDADVADRLLRESQDSFVYSDHAGFPLQTLPDFGTQAFLG